MNRQLNKTKDKCEINFKRKNKEMNQKKMSEKYNNLFNNILQNYKNRNFNKTN